MRKLPRIAMICVLLVTMTSVIFAVPASAEGPVEGNAFGAPPIPADVLAITGEAPFIALLSAETYARGGGLAIQTLRTLGEERDAIANELAYIGITVTPRGRYQMINPLTDRGSTDAIEELDKAYFESYMMSLLGTISSPTTEAEAKALENEIIGAVNSWLADYRAEVNAKLRAAPRPLLTGSRSPNSGRQAVQYRNMYKLQFDLEIHDFGADADKLTSILVSIGESDTLDEAWQRVNEFYAASNQMQAAAAGTAVEMEASITTVFTDWAQQFQTQYTADLEAHGAALGDAATLVLLEKAKREALRAKDEIIARLVEEIQAEMQASVGPGAKLTQGQINELMQIGFRIGMQRGAEEGLKAQERIQADYMAQADEARAQITAEMEAQAAEAEKWAMDELTRLGYLFGDIQQRAAANTLMPTENEILRWQAEAAQLRRSIYSKVLDHRLQEAYQTVSKYQQQINQGYAAGYLEYNADDLRARITEDREAQLDAFMAAGDSAAAIAAVEVAYNTHWNEMRQTLERAAFEASGQVIAALQEKVPWDDVRERALATQALANSEMIRKGFWENPNLDMEKDPATDRDPAAYCWWQKGAAYHARVYPAISEDIRKLALDGRRILDLAARWEAIRDNPDDYTVEEVVSFHNQFVTVWRDRFAPQWDRVTSELNSYTDELNEIQENCNQTYGN